MIRWLALGLWYAAIIFTSSLTSTPESGQPFRDYLINKGGHIFVYSVLGWIVSEALTAPAAGFAIGRRIALLATILSGAVLASLDETRQSFVYGRTALPTDVLLDTLALSGGALLHHRLVARTAASALAEPSSDLGQQSAVEDEHQLLHRENLAVAVDVRQERHHDRQVDEHEQVERPRARGPGGG
jgi:VanZ family protein